MQFQEDEIEKVREIFHSEFQKTLQNMTKNYRRTISDLLKATKKKEEEYEKLKIDKECVQVEQSSWCYLVRELLKQFQKFINYVLEKQSGYSGYLLSLEKLLNARVESLTEVITSTFIFLIFKLCIIL